MFRRRIWSYAVFSLTMPLAAFAKEVLYVESGAIGLAIGMWVEHRFRGLKDEVSSLAARYWRPMDRLKWCLTTLLEIGSIAGGIVVLAVGWYR